VKNVVRPSVCLERSKGEEAWGEKGEGIRENCQKTPIKRNNSAVDPSSDDPYEKTLMKRNNSLECLLNYARRLTISP